jgi:hypothetical protein
MDMMIHIIYLVLNNNNHYYTPDNINIGSYLLAMLFFEEKIEYNQQ